jgi:2'-5' RNA ligase
VIDRVFVAVWLPPELVEQLVELERPAVRGVRWTTADQWHVTLRFLGGVDDVTEVDSALAAAPLLTLGRTVAIAGPATDVVGTRIVSVPVAGLERLAAAVQRATAGMGRAESPRPFHGHVTLARLRQPDGRLAWSLAGAPVAAAWPVTDVTLVRSQLHSEGARYETVATYPVG